MRSPVVRRNTLRATRTVSGRLMEATSSAMSWPAVTSIFQSVRTVGPSLNCVCRCAPTDSSYGGTEWHHVMKTDHLAPVHCRRAGNTPGPPQRDQRVLFDGVERVALWGDHQVVLLHPFDRGAGGPRHRASLACPWTLWQAICRRWRSSGRRAGWCWRASARSWAGAVIAGALRRKLLRRTA